MKLKSCSTYCRVLIILVFFGVYSQRTAAQVSIAPTSIFLNDQSPFANLLISNGSDTPQEISISFRFGYAESDEEGNVVFVYDSTNRAQAMSINNNINAFPRNFILQPSQRQTIRLAARGIGNVDDGTYWTRVAILSSPISPPVETTLEGGVAAQINFNFEQVIPLFYRKGQVSTGIDVEGVTFESEDGIGRLLFNLNRTGNSPFLGSIDVQILDDENNLVNEQSANLTVYFDIVRAVMFDISDLGPGEYRANYVIRSQRRDISSNNVIQVSPIQQSKIFTIE